MLSAALPQVSVLDARLARLESVFLPLVEGIGVSALIRGAQRVAARSRSPGSPRRPPSDL
eukprot:318059-Lingulodinium_polyedra.AAC.1